MCCCTQWSLGGEGLGRTILTQNVLCLEPLAQQLFCSLNYWFLWSQPPRELHTFQNLILFLTHLVFVDEEQEKSLTLPRATEDLLGHVCLEEGVSKKVPKAVHITLSLLFYCSLLPVGCVRHSMAPTAHTSCTSGSLQRSQEQQVPRRAPRHQHVAW